MLDLVGIFNRYRVWWCLYGPLSILLFLCGSSGSYEWRMLQKFLESKTDIDKFFKSQNHNCSMTAVGVSGFSAKTS
jgi:hypothetical protein